MTRRISYERLARLSTELTPRDRQIVALVARQRIASGIQLRRLFWPEPGPNADRAARRAIDRLVRWRVLARLERRVGGVGRGSDSWSLALDTAGLRYVAGGDAPNARRPRLPRPMMWHHALQVTEAYVRLVEYTRASGHSVEWQGEPACWRTFVGPGGGRDTLKPDAFTVVADSAYEDRWFVELDNGSQHRPLLRAKCDSYLRYLASGLEQNAHGVFPRVAFLTNDPERIDLITRVIRARPEREHALFAVALVSDAGNLLAGDAT